MKRKERTISAYTPRHVRRLVQSQTQMEILNYVCPVAGTSTERTNACSPERNDNDQCLELDSRELETTTSEYTRLENDPMAASVQASCKSSDLSDISSYQLNNTPSDRSIESDYLSNSNTCEYDEEVEETEPIEKLDDKEDHDLKNDLRSWALHFNISHKALSALLVILIHQVVNCKIPKDARTLLKTPRQTNLRPCSNGAYWHWGLDKALSSLAVLYTKAKLVNETIKLLVNVDGLPLYKSASSCLWPILTSDTIFNTVFMVGAFYGEDKPKQASEYLESLVDEVASYICDGFVFMGRTFKIELHAIICDAPAKSFILNIKGHNAYFSCTKCTIEGSYLKHRMSFPYSETESSLRTDDGFANNEYEDYQHGPTILQAIPNSKLVSGVPLDCMHLIYLGVVKKTLLFWISGPLTVRLPAISIKNFFEILESLRNSVPNDFARRPRSLKHLRDWKATEFRQFLLYTGPIVVSFLAKMKPDVYKNFMTLHVAVSILTSPALVKNSANINYAAQLLRQFVKSFGEIYGTEHMSHNVHNLLHVCADVERYGALESFSAFRFENYLASVKRKVRSSILPLQQLAKRHGEIQKNEIQDRNPILNEIRLGNVHCNGPIADLNRHDITAQYHSLQNHNYSINCNDEKNNCCLLKNGQVVIAMNIAECREHKIYIIGKLLTVSKSFYTVPCPSETINVSIVNETGITCALPITDIKGKMWQVRVNRDLIVFPLRHTLATV